MRQRWTIRRRVVNLTLAFCAACILYLIIAGEDTRLHETIASGLILLSGSVIGSYIFGATWDDKGRIEINHGRSEVVRGGD